ncbi:MAG: cell wall hydrolase [Lachnospiraceae bacterium]|nr:cell wall hydrolase [Lachnospiraceae bacterium]
MEAQSMRRKRFLFMGLLFFFILLSVHTDADAAWKKNSNGTYSWYTSSGKLAKSKWINGTYYVNSKGVRVTGLQKISGKYYFFSKSTGKLITSTWIKSGGKYYYAQKSGVLCKSCIKKINGAYYYFNSKAVRKTGKQTRNNKTYFFSKSTGQMVTSKWVCISKKYYYFGSNGVMKKSCWVGLYYVNKNGARVTNTWKGSKYLGSDGACVSGLCVISGKTYYFDPDTYEKVTSTTLTIGDYIYSFNSSGVGTIISANDRPVATVSVEDTYYTDEVVDDVDLLAAIIYCEAGNQSYTGQLAVGLVLLNRVNSSKFEVSTLREAVYSKSQFTPAKNGTLNKVLSGAVSVTDSCKAAAEELMAKNEEYQTGATPTLVVDNEEIEFPYVYFMTPSAYRSLGLSAPYITIGAHVFFSVWK